MVLKLKTLSAVALAGLILAGCTQNEAPQDTFLKMVDTTGKWTMTTEEKTKYSKMGQNEGRALFNNSKFEEARSKLQTDEEKKMLAIAVYANFKMLQARAIPDYCQGMNVDISSFVSAFASANRSEEAALQKLMESRSDSFDALYAKYSKRLRTTSKYELMSAGSSYSACKTLKEKSSEIARQTKFTKFYPVVSAAMR